MKAKTLKRVSALAVLLTALMASTAFGFEARSAKATVYTTDKSTWGTVGTKEDPIVWVDGTDASFKDWADGVYFDKNCKFENITAADGKTYRLLPVYNGAQSVTISAGSGKFGTDSSVARTVNLVDGTIVNGKEVLENDAAYSLSAVLTALNATAAYSGYYPYFYKYYDSGKNKRIFVDASDPSKTTADGTLGSCVYDVKDKSLELVWKDNSGSAAVWNDTQKEKGKFIASRGTYTQAQYLAKWGGDASLPYGSVSLKKELPGADNLSCSWVLTKNGGSPETAVTSETYTKSSMDKSFDGAVLVETLTYGPSSEYSLTTENFGFTVYGVPTVSEATIE